MLESNTYQYLSVFTSFQFTFIIPHNLEDEIILNLPLIGLIALSALPGKASEFTRISALLLRTGEIRIVS
jgi:hypothetical protein